MVTDRANAVCLLEILLEYSDDEHILPMREIIAKMNAEYGIKPDRRTIYSAAGLLNSIGYDISMYDENSVGYFLRGREFDPSEVLLLTDAVCSFPFVPAKQSDELIEKLQTLVPAPCRRKFRHLNIARLDIKTDNRDVFYNISVLDDAITQKKKIQFTYLKYGLDKKLHPRRERPYIVNPYGMVYANEHYYLICNLTEHPDISLYRIDYIKDIAISEETLDERNDSLNAAKNAVYAYTGRPERITMRCDNEILGDVLSKFGTDVFLRKIDENSFSASFIASPGGVKYWALQYVTSAEVTAPESLRNEIMQSIKSNRYDV